MTKEEALRLVEEAAVADPGTLVGTESLDQIEWNSLANVSFIALVDERVGREPDAKAVARCKTVAELVDLITASA